MKDSTPVTSVEQGRVASDVWCKCERCGRIRRVFQYTKFVPRVMDIVRDNGFSANPRYTTERKDMGEYRGLCEECAVVVNCHAYDTRFTTKESTTKQNWRHITH